MVRCPNRRTSNSTMEFLKRAFLTILIWVQSTHGWAALTTNSACNAGGSTNGTSLVVSFPANCPVAGDLVFIGMSAFSAGAPSESVADNQTGNLYERGSWIVNASNDARVYFSSNVSVSGTYTITWSGLPAGAGPSAFMGTLQGFNTTTPHPDANVSGTGTSGSGTDNMTGAAITNSNVNSIIINIHADAGGGTCTETAGTNYTGDTTNWRQTAGATFECGMMEYRLVSASPNTPVATIPNGATFSNWTADFQQASGGAAVVTPRPRTQRMMGW